MFVVGILGRTIRLHELFRMYESVRPVRLAAFLVLVGIAVAAMEGGSGQVLLALAPLFPLMFLIGVATPREGGPSLTAAMSLTTFGVVGVGMAVGFGIPLRDSLPRRRARRRGACSARSSATPARISAGSVRHPQARAAHLAEQDVGRAGSRASSPPRAVVWWSD